MQIIPFQQVQMPASQSTDVELNLAEALQAASVEAWKQGLVVYVALQQGAQWDGLTWFSSGCRRLRSRVARYPTRRLRPMAAVTEVMIGTSKCAIPAGRLLNPVSYTHLTLPTIYSV